MMTEDEDPLDRLYKLLTRKKRVRLKPPLGPRQPQTHSSHNYVDMTGRRAGLGTLVKRSAPTIHGNVSWLYVCDCGMARWLSSNNLRKRPPKTHKFCHRGFKFVAEAVDIRCTGVYENEAPASG